MPFADSDGTRIHYHSAGDGAPLVLQHGFSGSIRSWHEAGYVDALAGRFRLIMSDTRGHGLSDKPHDPEAYDMALKVCDVTAVLDDLGIEKAHFLGYSLGGRTGYGMARYAPDRCTSIIIGGMHPYGSSGDEAAVQRRIDLLERGMEAYVADLEAAQGRALEPARRAVLLANDAAALVASSVELRDFAGIEGVLPSMTMPCLLYVGEEDFLYAGMQRCAREMPNARLVGLPGLTHLQAFERSDLVVPLVLDFIG